MQKQGISAFLALLSATVRGSNGTMIMRLANHEGMRLAYDKDEIKLPRKAGSLSIRSKILFKHCRPVVLWIGQQSSVSHSQLGMTMYRFQKLS